MTIVQLKLPTPLIVKSNLQSEEPIETLYGLLKAVEKSIWSRELAEMSETGR